VIAHEEVSSRYEVVSTGQIEVSDEQLRNSLLQAAV
jgi:hypothetical protein